MKNERFKRNMFSCMDTQRMAREALPFLISAAQKFDTVIMRDLAKEVAPHLTQFNFSMGYALGWIHTTLWELERSEDWNYGEIPGLTAIVLDKPEKPTNYFFREGIVDWDTPWEDYETNHILPVFEYPHWDKVMEFVYDRNEILADGEIPGPPNSGNSEDY